MCVTPGEPVRGTAEVRLSDHEVGELTFDKGRSQFRYTDNLLADDHRVLGQTFEERPRAVRRAPTGLPHWFANLLPEQGSGLRRYYMALLDDRRLDDGRLLLALGADLPGAVTVHHRDIPAAGVLLDSVVADVAEGRVHLSALAGAQAKMSVVRAGERLHLPASGESGSAIAKLPDRTFDRLPENEFLMMRWAAVSGIDTPPVELAPTSRVPAILEPVIDPDSHAYLIERFDRTRDGGRVHIEDLAQVVDVPPSARERGPGEGTSYDTIGASLLELTGRPGFDEYVRRLVAMLLMGNTDAHLKNWSLIYRDGSTPELSPAYDIVCATVYRQMAFGTLIFRLGGERMPNLVGVDQFRAMAEMVDVDSDEVAELAVQTAHTMAESWRAVRAEHGDLFPALTTHIDKRLARHPLLRRD